MDRFLAWTKEVGTIGGEYAAWGRAGCFSFYFTDNTEFEVPAGHSLQMFNK